MTWRSLLAGLAGGKVPAPTGSLQPDAEIQAAPHAHTLPPTVTWAAAGTSPVLGIACPNCGEPGPKPPVLAVDFTPLGRARQIWSVLGCDDCTCRFYARQEIADYGSDEMLSRGRAALYLQHGAGLSQLIRPLARVPGAPGTRFLDVGCGFGFGLDFAIRARGWTGLGIDPAQIAALGIARLGLQIEQRLLRDDEPGFEAAFDVAAAAETLEHVPSPPAFLRLLSRTLTADGVLILTTPDAEALRPDTPAGQLVGLLSPELHLVFQSARSLRRLLTDAGFDHIEIIRDGGALVATASRIPLALQTDPTVVARAYLDHLEARARDCADDPDLVWGFGGRALTEAVNAGDFDRAERLRPMLWAAARRQFSLDLDHALLPAETVTCSLERMAALIPLSLGALLYADAMLQLGRGAPRPGQESRLLLSARASRRLNRAVSELAMADPSSEELEWVATVEAALSAAASPIPHNLTSRLVALPAAPGGNTARRDAALARAFVTLVNGARYDDARSLRRALPVFKAGRATLGEDAVFCRAVLGLQPGGDAEAAREDFAWVRHAQAGKAGGRPGVQSLFWAALRGEIAAHAALGLDREGQALRLSVTRAISASGGAVPEDLLSA